jgi:hypothetical protein
MGLRFATALLWLAFAAPAAAQPQTGGIALEHNMDRPGGDYRTFVMDDINFNTCVKACVDEQRCSAFTFVFPPSPGDKASCRLKDSVPAPVSHFCCISGKK